MATCRLCKVTELAKNERGHPYCPHCDRVICKGPMLGRCQPCRGFLVGRREP